MTPRILDSPLRSPKSNQITITGQNLKIAEQPYRPQSCFLTTMSVKTEAHDQNKRRRCSKLKLEYVDAGGQTIFSFQSDDVPRSGSFQPFHWNQDVNEAVESGGKLELSGFGCSGAGIHVRNTEANFVMDLSDTLSKTKALSSLKAKSKAGFFVRIKKGMCRIFNLLAM